MAEAGAECFPQQMFPGPGKPPLRGRVWSSWFQRNQPRPQPRPHRASRSPAWTKKVSAGAVPPKKPHREICAFSQGRTTSLQLETSSRVLKWLLGKYEIADRSPASTSPTALCFSFKARSTQVERRYGTSVRTKASQNASLITAAVCKLAVMSHNMKFG